MKLCDIKIILFCHIIVIHEYNKVNTFSKVLTFMANSAGYSLRISRELLDKIKYISEAEGRSMNAPSSCILSNTKKKTAPSRWRI